MAMQQYVAAWVPEDLERSWDEAAELAVAWLLEQAQGHPEALLLVTPHRNQWSAGAQAVQQFAHRHEAATPRTNRPGRGPRPVLAYVPDYATFDFAVGFARGSALAVVESSTDPLRGWAMEVAALNLTTGQVTVDTRSPEMVALLERLHFYGNNGWTTGFGEDQAVRILREAQQRGPLDPDLVLGYMVAMGHSGKSIDRLRQIMDKAG